MASGILGQAALSADTDTSVYTVPASTLATVNINVCNRGETAALIRIALAASGAPGSSEYIEYNATLEPGGVLERTGFMLHATKRVVVRSSNGDTSVTVHGPERAA